MGKREQSEQPEKPEQAESIKEQYKGTYIYLPPALREEFDLVAAELDTARRRQSGKRVEKIRHFEPLIIKKGLEKVADADDDELEEWIAEFDPE